MIVACLSLDFLLLLLVNIQLEERRPRHGRLQLQIRMQMPFDRKVNIHGNNQEMLCTEND